MESRIPASERTSQKLNELPTRGVAEGDARSELIKLAVRKIVEEAREAEVAEAVERGYGGDFGIGRSDFGSLGFSGPIEGSSTPVPELASVLLLTTGLISVAALRRARAR